MCTHFYGGNIFVCGWFHVCIKWYQSMVFVFFTFIDFSFPEWAFLTLLVSHYNVTNTRQVFWYSLQWWAEFRFSERKQSPFFPVYKSLFFNNSERSSTRVESINFLPENDGLRNHFVVMLSSILHPSLPNDQLILQAVCLLYVSERFTTV